MQATPFLISSRRTEAQASKTHDAGVGTKNIVACSTEGRRYYATVVECFQWIRSPLGIAAMHDNQQ
jgi:hypothetical protein